MSMSSLRPIWCLWFLLICLSGFVISICFQKWFPVIYHHPYLNSSYQLVKSKQDLLANINSSLTFLHSKKLFISYSRFKQSHWIQQLVYHLQQHNSNQIILITADHLYEDIFFNWLAAAHLKAQISIHDVLILSLDDILCQTLLDYNIETVCVRKHEVIDLSAEMHTSLSHVWIIRCMITRLLNYWGYDVLMFDLDAVLLKDPRPLFEHFKQSDIIGSQGKYPFELSREWGGVTLCMGVVMFRSTHQTTIFWENSKLLHSNVQDDQVRVNKILHQSAIKWFVAKDCPDFSHCTVTGLTKEGINVTLLSQDIICRQSCKKDHNYYIWHGRASRSNPSKMSKAREGDAWFLREDWKKILHSTIVTGMELIVKLSNE